MKFPSLFRLPKNQKFDIKPRYYDPDKERRDQIRMGYAESSEQKEDESEYRVTRIRFSKKTNLEKSTSIIKLSITVVLILIFLAWLEFGNDIVYYSLWIILLSYALYRLKSIKKDR